MRVLQLVTLFTPDGAYGGPVRVALNQSAALRESQIEVHIAGAHSGYSEPPTNLDGVPLHLHPAIQALPGMGFAGLISPGLFLWSRRHLRSFDVLHVHLARDLVTMPIARLALLMKIPVVSQTHGMIDPSHRLLAGPMDRLLTRTVLHGSKRVFYLTGNERNDLERVAGPMGHMRRLTNGVPLAKQVADSQGPREVLFLARLHRRKRPVTFARASMTVSRRHPDVRFTLVGPDQGEGNNIREFLEQHDGSSVLSWEGAIAPDATDLRLSRAYIYVLPAVDEPYPMSVLEAMSQGVPVIVTDSCGLANDVKESRAGLVVDSQEESLIEAMDRILSDPELHSEMSLNARKAVVERFGMDRIARQLEDAYNEAAT